MNRNRYLCRIIPALIVAAFFVGPTPPAVSQDKVHPRTTRSAQSPTVVTKPSRVYAPKQRDAVDVREYLKRTDPKVAAEELYREALRLNLYLDSIPPNPTAKRKKDWFLIDLPGASIEPSEIDAGFVEELDSLVHEEMVETPVVSIVQYRRYMSLNEIIGLLRKGVRFYDHLPPSAFLVATSPSITREMLQLPFVRWMGEYEAQYKYEAGPWAKSANKVTVYTFENDREEFQNDLAGVGAKVIQVKPGAYFLEIDGSRIKDLAEFWWVREIIGLPTPVGPMRDSEVGEPEPSPPQQGLENMNFHASDPRRLINTNVGPFAGTGIIVGELDTGWQIRSIRPQDATEPLGGRHEPERKCKISVRWGFEGVARKRASL